MKFSDIEKKIKKELGNVAVPDVYSKVKITPINKLLSTPAEVFKKNLAVALLALTLAIFAVMSLSLFAFLAFPNGSQVASNTYINIAVTNNDTTQVIGVVCDKNGIIICAVDEISKKNIPSAIGFDVNANIANLFSKNENDLVKVFIHNDLPSFANDLHLSLDSSLQKAYGSVASTRYILVQDAESKASLVKFINRLSLQESASTSQDIENLTFQYIALTQKLG